MIDIKHDVCKFDNCKKRANFNFEGEKKALFCVSHKEINMIDVKNIKCNYKDCNCRANYNLPGSIAAFCTSHKKEG
jgi:hypothetical protein